jgi:hypothetical protein
LVRAPDLGASREAMSGRTLALARVFRPFVRLRAVRFTAVRGCTDFAENVPC